MIRKMKSFYKAKARSLDEDNAAPLVDSPDEVPLDQLMEQPPAEDAAVVLMEAEEPPSACEGPHAEGAIEMDCHTELAQRFMCAAEMEETETCDSSVMESIAMQMQAGPAEVDSRNFMMTPPPKQPNFLKEVLRQLQLTPPAVTNPNAQNNLRPAVPKGKACAKKKKRASFKRVGKTGKAKGKAKAKPKAKPVPEADPDATPGAVAMPRTPEAEVLEADEVTALDAEPLSAEMRAIFERVYDAGVPAEAFPQGTTGKKSYTVQLMSGATIEVLFAGRAFVLKAKVGFVHPRTHIAWHSFGGCPQAAWEHAKSLVQPAA